MGEKLQAINKHWINVVANTFLKTSNIKTPYVTKTAGEFIFGGYDDPLLDILIKLKPYVPYDLPFNKVGWFYGVIIIYSNFAHFFNICFTY